MKVQHYLFLFWIVLAGLLNACKSKSEGDLTDGKTSQLGDLVLAESTDVMAQTIGVQGGELEVKDAQSPLNGFKISVPAGAYSSAVSFSVSAAEVVKHSFGNEYKVLSPLISIEGPSGYINKLARIEVPIALPEDYFAAAVFFNKDGKHDLLPMISLSPNKIVTATNSFGSMSVAGNSRVASLQEALYIVILAINRRDLLNGTFHSGFKPEFDAWPFTNYGSVLTFDGYCSGAATSSLWYFMNKKKGNSEALFTNKLGQGKNAPPELAPKKLENSNVNGIKYVSIIQELTGKLGQELIEEMSNFKEENRAIRDLNTVLFSALYFKMVKVPLLLGLKKTSWLGFWESGGHMVSIIGKNDGNLLISDPNFPGETRYLKYGVLGLENYFSGKTRDHSSQYDILFALPPWLFDKGLVNEGLWPLFENGSIGLDPGFPRYSFSVSGVKNGGQGVMLTSEGINYIISPFTISPQKTPSGIARIRLYNEAGDSIPKSTGYYALPVGKHKIGIETYELVKNKNDNQDAAKEFRWADFQWFDIEIVKDNYPNCQITTPEGLSVDKAGEVDKQYTFSLGSNCSLPAKTLFFWDFGDGTTTEAVDNPIARHTFTKSGDFTVKLRLLPDGAADYIIRETKVRIGQPDNTSPEYFTYKMNGVAFSDSDPSSSYINSPPNEGLFLDGVNGVGIAYKVVVGKGWDGTYHHVYLGVIPSQWKGVGSYELTKFEKGKIANATAVVGGPGTNVISDSGTLTITRKDNLWIEGTFNFKAGSYNVTEGKFRIKF